jgi:hypothetical protein
MYKKLLILFLLSISWMANGYATTQHSISKTCTITTTSTTTENHHPTTLPLFSAINVIGSAKVILICQQQKQNVSTSLSPEASTSLHISAQNQTLFITSQISQDQPTPVISVSMSQPLRNLRASGSANIQAQNCGNPDLVVTAKDTANIRLTGSNTLNTLQNDGMNTIAVENISGKNLVLGGKNNGKIIVSGKVDEMDAKLEGATLLDARRLQTRSAHILTRNNAAAYVYATEVLYGFAYNNSNIYYYETPRRVMKEPRASGNVLAAKP